MPPRTPYQSEPSQEEQSVKEGVSKVLTGLTVAVLVLAALTSWVTITPGHVGIVFNKIRGGVQPVALHQGYNFRWPLVETITEYPVSLRTYSDLGAGEGTDKTNSLVDVPTLQNQHIQQAISIVYNVQPEKAFEVFNRFQGQSIETIETSYIRRSVVSAAGIVFGKYSITDIASHKGEIQDKITTALREQLTPLGFYVDKVNLAQSVYPESIEKSLQAKSEAEQGAETAKFRLLQAETDAKASVAKAEGTSKAYQLERQQLTPELIKLRALEVQKQAIEKWDGKLPVYSLGSNTTPMINLQNGDK